jgi:WD40 repeat protein
LISCSTDNTAIVFDTNKDKKVKILAEHKGWVNGVAWDPSDQYIATIASDRFGSTALIVVLANTALRFNLRFKIT